MQQMTRMPRKNSNSPPASPRVDGHQPASLPPHIPKSRGEETNPPPTLSSSAAGASPRGGCADQLVRHPFPLSSYLRVSHTDRAVREEEHPRPSERPEAAMRRAQAAAFLLLLFALVVAAAEARRQKGGEETVCDKGWECSESRFCCNETITEYFKASQFEKLFARRNDSLAHAAGFWDYQAFIAAAALFEPRGFGTTGGREMGMKEVAAFLGHVGAKTSCGYGSPTGDSLAWGLCYNHELSPSQSYYCDNSNELYRCVEGVKYYGRGALPVYWNYNYGIVGKGIKQDLLNHPELLEQNATLAFEAAIWRWMTPMKRKQPSAHDAFVGNWKPTKKDTLSNRHPGFGVTMNILYGDLVCGRGSIDNMNFIISHYQHYLDLMGVGHDHAGDNLDCGDQVAFNPSSKIPDS